MNEKINNGYVVEGGGFTLEAAFNVYDTSIFRTIVAKEGQPGVETGMGNPDLPTLALKVRGPRIRARS